MEPITITLTGAPVGKGRPRVSTRNGFVRTFTPEKTRNYEAALRIAGQQEMQGRAPIEGPVAIVMSAIFPIPESWSRKKRDAALRGEIKPSVKPDIDNLLKTLDALNEVVWRDDKQIVSAQIAKVYGPAPLLAITVRAA
jgi:Holliday junction resolvase RusA-like endonuclease